MSKKKSGSSGSNLLGSLIGLLVLVAAILLTQFTGIDFVGIINETSATITAPLTATPGPTQPAGTAI
ncbi:MAG: hypothetical protein AAF125_17660, partial [Chloroflexota bacterium]